MVPPIRGILSHKQEIKYMTYVWVHNVVNWILFQKFRKFQADPLVIENRQRAPQTMIPGGIKGADYYDAYVDANSGKCLPYPCPFAIKIYFSKIEDSSYNGYYVINPPATFLGETIKKLSSWNNLDFFWYF